MNDRNRPEIICPACRTGRLAPRSESNGNIPCQECGAVFAVKDSVIDLIPDFVYEPSRGQALMEWEPLINIYESRWWRKSGLFGVITGIGFDHEYKLILAALNLKGDEVILDLACGPGIYSRPFAQILDRGTVVGLDLSEPMLNYAGAKARDEGIENIVLIRGSALDLPFPDGEFDAVNCCGAVHLFPDTPKALAEVHRVLKPGAVFAAAVFRNWLPGQWSRQMADRRYQRTGVKHFHPEELESLLTDAELEDVTFHHSKRYWQVVSAIRPE